MKANIAPTHGRLVVDCPHCKSRDFQVHVRVTPGSKDAHIEEIVCTNCATWYRTQFGLLGGEMNKPVPGNDPAKGVQINVPLLEMKVRH